MDLDDPNSFMGKTILVGITYVNADGKIERRIQHFGTVRIEAASWHPDGRHSPLVEVPTIVVERDGRELTRFPYDKRAIAIAKKGVYTLRATGEQVSDPDLISQWEVRGSQGQGSTTAAGNLPADGAN
jgi:hypothetical protein